MRQVTIVFGLCLGLFWGVAAIAQQRAWVQIEAQPTLPQAQERARAYAQAFPDVAGFRLTSGWYAVALGPFTPEAALEALGRLRRENLIPADSFIAGGEAFRQPFWPVGQNPAEAPITGITVPEVTASPLPEVRPVDTLPSVTAPDPTAALPDAQPQTPPDAVAAQQPDRLPDPAPLILPEPPREHAAVPLSVMPADETPEEARRSEARLGRDARMDLQAALKWFGFYAAAIDGAIGPGTRASMAEWQAANGHEATGVLTSAQRMQLVDEKTRIEAELGLQTLTENEAGIEISLPMALVAFDQYEPPFVHFASRNASGIRAVLISLPGDQSALFRLYDSLQTLRDVPPTGERTRLERSFTINAVNGTIASYTYAELSQGLIKGYMLIWNPADATVAGKAARALAAMKSSFTTIGRRALDPGLVSLDEGTRRGLMAGMEVRRPALSRSGFFVSPDGAVLTTTEALDGCRRLTLDRDTEADVAARDDGLGLALLTPRKALAPRHVATFRTTPAPIGAEIAVAGYSYEDALPAPTLTFGTLAQTSGLAGEVALNRLSLTSLPGDAGGPVMDSSGAVLGMLMPASQDPNRSLPPEVAFLTTSDAILPLFGQAGIQAQSAPRTGALAPEDLTDFATAMTVLVSCWK